MCLSVNGAKKNLNINLILLIANHNNFVLGLVLGSLNVGGAVLSIVTDIL